MNETRTNIRRRWLWIAGIWSSIALFEATQTVFGMRLEGMHHNWTALFLTVLFSWLPWLLITPVALRLSRKHSLNWMTALMHAGVALSMTVIASAWLAWMIVWANPYMNDPPPGPFMSVWFAHFSNSILNSLMLYGAILAVRHIVESRARLAWQQTETARLNEQLSRAQLEALRRQIEPHFLFNSLNSISGLVRDDRNDEAVRMIARLSEFLRRVIEDSNRQLVRLSEEIDFSERYLEIQKVRFADRLELSADVPEDLLSAQVPSLLLQPMVENAIKHGISKRAHGGAIRISATRNNEMLTLRVYNDGPPFPFEREKASGVGIANVRTRLHSLYGDAFSLTVQNQEPHGVEVAVSMPYRDSQS